MMDEDEDEEEEGDIEEKEDKNRIDAVEEEIVVPRSENELSDVLKFRSYDVEGAKVISFITKHCSCPHCGHPIRLHFEVPKQSYLCVDFQCTICQKILRFDSCKSLQNPTSKKSIINVSEIERIVNGLCAGQDFVEYSSKDALGDHATSGKSMFLKYSNMFYTFAIKFVKKDMLRIRKALVLDQLVRQYDCCFFGRTRDDFGAHPLDAASVLIVDGHTFLINEISDLSLRIVPLIRAAEAKKSRMVDEEEDDEDSDSDPFLDFCEELSFDGRYTSTNAFECSVFAIERLSQMIVDWVDICRKRTTKIRMEMKDAMAKILEKKEKENADLLDRMVEEDLETLLTGEEVAAECREVVQEVIQQMGLEDVVPEEFVGSSKQMEAVALMILLKRRADSKFMGMNQRLYSACLDFDMTCRKIITEADLRTLLYGDTRHFGSKARKKGKLFIDAKKTGLTRKMAQMYVNAIVKACTEGVTFGNGDPKTMWEYIDNKIDHHVIGSHHACSEGCDKTSKLLDVETSAFHTWVWEAMKSAVSDLKKTYQDVSIKRGYNTQRVENFNLVLLKYVPKRKDYRLNYSGKIALAILWYNRGEKGMAALRYAFMDVVRATQTKKVAKKK